MSTRENVSLQQRSSENLKRLPDEPRSCSTRNFDEIYGPPELCTWRYASGTCRFQTTDSKLARKLSGRQNCKLVACSVGGGYLRIFQESMSFGRAKRLVTRYLMRANERLLPPKNPTPIDNPARSMGSAAKIRAQSSAVIGSNSEPRLPA